MKYPVWRDVHPRHFLHPMQLLLPTNRREIRHRRRRPMIMKMNYYVPNSCFYCRCIQYCPPAKKCHRPPQPQLGPNQVRKRPHDSGSLSFFLFLFCLFLACVYYCFVWVPRFPVRVCMLNKAPAYLNRPFFCFFFPGWHLTLDPPTPRPSGLLPCADAPSLLQQNLS